MSGKLRFFGSLILAIQLSSCPESTRMAWEFDYPGTKAATLVACKQILEELGYEIDVYAPESNLIVTTQQPIKYFLQRYDYSLVLGIEDRLKIFVTAQKYVYKRGSQLSLFGSTMIENEQEDKLPFKLQNEILNPIRGKLQTQGIIEFSSQQQPVAGRL